MPLFTFSKSSTELDDKQSIGNFETCAVSFKIIYIYIAIQSTFVLFLRASDDFLGWIDSTLKFD